MTSSTLRAMGVGGDASWARLDSGTVGGWPLRTGPGWAKSPGGHRGLSVGGGEAAASLGWPWWFVEALVIITLVVHASGGASDPVQLQSAGRSRCRLWWSTFL